MAGQTATALGTFLQVVAPALAPVAIVQPVLAGGLVVAPAIRSVRDRCLQSRLDGTGAVLTCGGLAVFLVAARPAAGNQLPPWFAVGAAVLVAVGPVAACSRIRRGSWGALACGAAAGIAAAVLISAAMKTFGERGLLPTVGGTALWGARRRGGRAAGQPAGLRAGRASGSMPALVLPDPSPPGS